MNPRDRSPGHEAFWRLLEGVCGVPSRPAGRTTNRRGYPPKRPRRSARERPRPSSQEVREWEALPELCSSAAKIARIATVRTTSKVEAAIAYAKLGFVIHPLVGAVNGVCMCKQGRHCDLPGKHRLWIRGVRRPSTTSVATIRYWWSQGDWNIATPTGKRAGFWGLDIDAKPADEVLNALLERGIIPQPFAVARSGRGGLHAYIAYAQMPPPVGSGEYLVPGVDVLAGRRSDGSDRGSYAMLPPSETTTRYAWL